uniref:NADH-ubiquinone oxidoreductase chain 6 n=1 Tax=Chiridota sp. SS-2021 TaxID=2834204 RepID=A0A8E5JZI3_9ECHN|nr:NADH dehydrogenase subunit 6 [Chiridota sp. SS-2021]
MVFSILGLLVVGATLTAYSLSPYFGALGLVLVSLSLCSFLALFGFSFLGLVVLLTYLGGMLVVFAYSNALSADRFPMIGEWKETCLVFGLSITWFCYFFNSFFSYPQLELFLIESYDWSSSGLFYFTPVLILVVGLVLLVVLVLVLVLSFGSYENTLRKL